MRQPKSVTELRQSGTYRKDRHEGRLEEAVLLLDEVPPPPKHFDKKHREKWSELCVKVYELGVLSESDLDSIEAYVQWWFIGRDAWEDIQKNGYTITNDKGSIQRNPSIITMNEATKICQNIADKFAGSPRARMVIKTGKQDASKIDPLARFLEY